MLDTGLEFFQDGVRRADTAFAAGQSIVWTITTMVIAAACPEKVILLCQCMQLFFHFPWMTWVINFQSIKPPLNKFPDEMRLGSHRWVEFSRMGKDCGATGFVNKFHGFGGRERKSFCVGRFSLAKEAAKSSADVRNNLFCHQ